MGSSRRIEKCPQSGWGCMGGGATDHHLEDHHNPVQLYRSTITRLSYCSATAGPGVDDPEHDESTPAETKIVTIVLPSCIILRL